MSKSRDIHTQFYKLIRIVFANKKYMEHRPDREQRLWWRRAGCHLRLYCRDGRFWSLKHLKYHQGKLLRSIRRHIVLRRIECAPRNLWIESDYLFICLYFQTKLIKMKKTPSGNLNMDFSVAVAWVRSEFISNFVIICGSMGHLFGFRWKKSLQLIKINTNSKSNWIKCFNNNKNGNEI